MIIGDDHSYNDPQKHNDALITSAFLQIVGSEVLELK